jgi:CRISPR-associated Csx2 family protein
MPRILISILGKGRYSHETGYQTANYQFPDGRVLTTPFLGLALNDYLQPDQLILIGTAGSQWGVLCSNIAEDESDLETSIALQQAEEAEQVDQALLDRATPIMSRKAGRPVRPWLIPYGRDEAEQIGILQGIANLVQEGEISFDLTHGFRHLGMVGLISAYLLTHLRNVQVAGLWYGALDMTRDMVTPVLRLDGLSAVHDWVAALDRFDHSGDYGVFAPLLERDGVTPRLATFLRDAAFYERNFNLRDARARLKNFLDELPDRLPGASGLFRQPLQQRLAWATRGTLADHQRQLAWLYLDRRDYVRALVLAWEALISAECQQHRLNPDDHKPGGDRKQAEESLRNSLKESGEKWHNSPKMRIQHLRNALAHGSAPPDWAKGLKDALSNEDKLRKMLHESFQEAIDKP